MNIKKGRTYLAALDAVAGREISKTQPVVVCSNDKNNEFSDTVTILPVTSKNIRKIYPSAVLCFIPALLNSRYARHCE